MTEALSALSGGETERERGEWERKRKEKKKKRLSMPHASWVCKRAGLPEGAWAMNSTEGD